MKKLTLFLIISTITIALFAQRKADFGVIGGTTFYLGEINQEKPFYRPGYHAGAIFRYNIDKRHSFRLKSVYAQVSGSDDDFDNFIVGRPATTFSTSLVNTAAQFEYNFFDYLTGNIAYDWTPYVYAGVGYSLILSSGATTGLPANSHVNIPFGFGFKFNLGKRWSSGVEWTFNKTFSDRVDGVIPPIEASFLYKNDWYNFVGLFITYKFFKFAADCPVYD
jgi:hypothetical protein